MPKEAATYMERSFARMRRLSPNRVAEPHQLYDDQLTPEGMAIHDYVNLLGPILAF